MSLRVLVIFACDPNPGQVKTCLAKHLGHQAACDLYEKLLRFTLGIAYDFQKRRPKTHVNVGLIPSDCRDSLTNHPTFSGYL